MGAPCPPETPSWVALDFGGPLKKKKGLREGHEGGVGRRVTGGHLLGGGLRGRGRGARGSDPPLKDTARSGAGVSSGQATRSEHKPEGSPLPAVQQPQALPPSPVPGGGGGSPPPTLLLLLLPPLALLPQLQSVWAPPLLPCRLLPPAEDSPKDLCQVEGVPRTVGHRAEVWAWGSSTCCPMSSPHLPQGSTQQAAAPEDRAAEAEDGLVPRPALVSPWGTLPLDKGHHGPSPQLHPALPLPQEHGCQ